MTKVVNTYQLSEQYVGYYTVAVWQKYHCRSKN